MSTFGKRLGEPVVREERPHERQAARLSSEGAAADAGERARDVERLAVEVDDERPVPILAVRADGADEALPQVLVRREVGDPFAGAGARASANSVRAFSHFEKWLRSA